MSTGNVNRDILPLRHHDEEYEGATKRTIRAARIVTEDVDRAEDLADYGLLHGAVYLEPRKRPKTTGNQQIRQNRGIGGWGWAIPMAVVPGSQAGQDTELGFDPTSDSLSRAQVAELAARDDAPVSTALLPITGGDAVGTEGATALDVSRVDDSFLPIPFADAANEVLGFDVRTWTPPIDWSGVMVAGTDMDTPARLFVPGFHGIPIGDSTQRKADLFGVGVYRVGGDGEINAGVALSSLLAVVDNPAAVALDLRRIPDRTHGGIVLAPSAGGDQAEGTPARLSGVLCSGTGPGDAHGTGGINSAHLLTLAPWIDPADRTHDGPLNFLPEDHPATRVGTIPHEVDCRYNPFTQRWHWSVLQTTYSDGDDPPDPPTPGDPEGPGTPGTPGTPEGPGDGSGDGPGGPVGEGPGVRGRRPGSPEDFSNPPTWFPGAIEAMPTAGSPHEWHVPGVAVRAIPVVQPWAEDTRPAQRMNPERLDAFRCLPVALHLEGYGYELADGSGWADADQEPLRYSKAPATAGGAFFLPPELGMEAYRDAWAPAGVTASTTYIGLLGGSVRLALAEPNPTTGGVANGYTVRRGGTRTNPTLVIARALANATESDVWEISAIYDLQPSADNAFGLGTASRRLLYTYTMDAHVYSELTMESGSTLTLSAITNGTSLPTSDPGVAGRLWNDGGTVKVSS